MIHAAPSFDRALEEVDEVRPFTDFRRLSPFGTIARRALPSTDEVRPQRGPHLDIGSRRWKGVLGMVSIFTGRK